MFGHDFEMFAGEDVRAAVLRYIQAASYRIHLLGNVTPFRRSTSPCSSTDPFIIPTQCSCCVRRHLYEVAELRHRAPRLGLALSSPARSVARSRLLANHKIPRSSSAVSASSAPCLACCRCCCIIGLLYCVSGFSCTAASASTRSFSFLWC